VARIPNATRVGRRCYVTASMPGVSIVTRSVRDTSSRKNLADKWVGMRD